MKNISLIGATGSIGRQTLEVVKDHKELLQVVAMASGKRNLSTFAEQIKRFRPELVSVPTNNAALELKGALGSDAKRVSIEYGEQGLEGSGHASRRGNGSDGSRRFSGTEANGCGNQTWQDDSACEQRNISRRGGVIMPMVKQYGATAFGSANTPRFINVYMVIHPKI